MPHTIIDDADVGSLISRLARPLSVADREAFRAAARAALAHVPVHGEGANFRAVANLQRVYFTPPTRRSAGWDMSDEISTRPSKLTSLPPIEGGGDGRRVRKHVR